MAYLGAVASMDFMRCEDTIYVRVFNRWCAFCSIYDWLATYPGKVLLYLKKLRAGLEP